MFWVPDMVLETRMQQGPDQTQTPDFLELRFCDWKPLFEK